MSLWEFLQDRRDLLIFLSYQHLSLVVQSLVVAAILAVVVACLIYRNRQAVGLATATSAVGLTLPSFALLALLVGLFGFGIWPSVVALVFYAALVIMRNAVVGLAGVDASLIDAARGMGMRRLEILRRIELPIAWPVIMTGIRTSAQMTMGIAAIAAYVGGPGLGGEIFSGLSRIGGANAVNEALVGTFGIAVLALLLDLVLMIVGRLTTPRGTRV